MLFLHVEKLSALLGAELGILKKLWKNPGLPSSLKHQALWESLWAHNSTIFVNYNAIFS